MKHTDEGSSERWVVCLLITGDREGIMAVSAEGLLKTTLLREADGAQPIASTVARYSDLSDDAQAQWHLLLQRDADDW